ATKTLPTPCPLPCPDVPTGTSAVYKSIGIVYAQERSASWMVSPVCLCRRAWTSFVNADKIQIVRRVVEFLTSLAPLTTLVIILLLSYYSYQLLEASGVNTIIVYFFSIEIFGNWLLFFCTKSYIDKSSGNRKCWSYTPIFSGHPSAHSVSDRFVWQNVWHYQHLCKHSTRTI
ncbi:hypothetical protein OTU49_011257, partial [Cherax quadricarinatus]